MSLSLYDSPPPPLPPRRRKRSKKVPKLPTRNHRKHRLRTPPPRKKPPIMPTKHLTNLKLNHLPMTSLTGLARNPSNLDKDILLGSPLQPENLARAAEFGMIPVARAYKPKKHLVKLHLIIQIIMV